MPDCSTSAGSVRPEDQVQDQVHPEQILCHRSARSTARSSDHGAEERGPNRPGDAEPTAEARQPDPDRLLIDGGTPGNLRPLHVAESGRRSFCNAQESDTGG